MQTVSIIVPLKDEQDTVQELVMQVTSAFKQIDQSRAALKEIVLVDDGSIDNTWQEIFKVINQHPEVTGVRLRRNFGKATALQAGIRHSQGNLIVTMDGDLQDDPKEISRFLDAIHNGSDLVSGWKKERKDPLGKTLPSKIFNRVTASISGVPLHDFNCGFKAYRREVFDNIRLYGELHRFIPAFAHAAGFRVSELVVQHHPRRFGKSKYGVSRLLKGFIDLLTVVTITRFNSRPGHLFGGIGFFIGAIGLFIFVYLCSLWIGGAAIGGRPLLLVSVLLMTVGVQVTTFGMVAELIVALRSDDRELSCVSEVAGEITKSV